MPMLLQESNDSRRARAPPLSLTAFENKQASFEERTKLERTSAIALHVLEIEHHVDFNNPENLSKYWPIYRDRINAEQSSLATSRRHAT